jgi:hypothetical protein
MTRSPAKTDMLRALGARPVVADAFDPDAVARAVAETEPEVIVHQLTALKGDPEDVPSCVELRWRPRMIIRPLPPPDPRVCV